MRRERERDAAALFAEVLRTLKLYLDLSHESYGRGEPFGSITLRMLRSARRELDIYDRNRETLFLLRHGPLRFETLALMGRLTFALDRVLEHTDSLAGDLSNEVRAELIDGRQQAYSFLTECAAQMPDLVERLSTLGKIESPPMDTRAALGPSPPA